MKKLITERRWKDQIRRRQVSELRRRSRAKPRYRAPTVKRGFRVLQVPPEFSIIRNADAMNKFLRTLKWYARTSHISLDLTDVTLITPEAIAALAATISHSSLPDTIVRGNLPSAPDTKQVLLESGFFDHVKSTTELPKGRIGKINEHQSNRVEAETARELIECGTLQAFGAMKMSPSTRAAYATLIEVMGNTHNHAAGEEEETETWWATVYGDSTRRRVCYSFLDMGVGIFKSVNLRGIRKMFRRLGLGDNSKLLLEILEGRVESRTGLSYRGKGLPTIYKKSRSRDITSLFIISNDVYADVTNGDYRTLSEPFPGTLLYWESEE